MIAKIWKYVGKPLLHLLLAIVLFTAYLYWRDSPPRGAPMGEKPDPDEEYFTGQLIAAAISTSISSRATVMGQPPPPTATTAQTSPGYRTDTYRRDVHAKPHGCLAATFTVNKVADPYAVGLFATPGQYDAIIRFSSGSNDMRPDAVKDVRGMAIKVLGVPGPKLLESQQDAMSQDFVMMNNPIFFIRTLNGYLQLNNLLAAGDPYTYFIGPRNPLTWHVRELWLALRAQKEAPASLITTRYWSASSYAFGPNEYVKYSLIPHASNKVKAVTLNANNEFDRLRLELMEHATAGGDKFDFAVQFQKPGENMPIEDTTVEWKESDSPFSTLATVEIKRDPEANTSARNDQCEGLSFNPWYSLPAHRPVGVMNRVRKALYDAMHQFRNEKNATAAGTPTP